MNFRKSNSDPGMLMLNVISLVDVLMVLVVFLLVSWSVSRIESTLSISIPSSTTATPLPAPAAPVVLNVGLAGGIHINNQSLTDEAAAAMLSRLASVNEHQVVLVRADKALDYQRILQVLDLCQKANISDISFAALSPTDK